MSYEIPQKLQYEEKIIFGLTFKQLIYAVIFILPALTIFLKTGWSLYLKITIGFILVSLSVLFMFFSFSDYIKNLLSWLKFREAWLMDRKMKDFLGIEKIEDGVFYVQK